MGYHDIGDYMFWIGETIALILFLIFLLVVIHVVFITPIVAEDALQECQERGFTTYEDYTDRLFDTEAYGVKCEHPIKNYNVDGQGMALVAVS